MVFDDANASGNLSYSFSTPVASVHDKGSVVDITGRTGEVFKAKRVISCVPLNVLHSNNFTPALLPLKKQVSLEGHVNHVVKCHIEVAEPELRSLSAFNYPHGKLTYTFGDDTTPAGNTHLLAFGSSLPTVHLQPEENMDETLEAWKGSLLNDRIRTSKGLSSTIGTRTSSHEVHGSGSSPTRSASTIVR